MGPLGARVAVVGAGECGAELAELARRVGLALAREGAVVLTGGRGGVMAAASAGAREAGGLSVGILPGADAGESPPNPEVDLPLFTGLGQARNQVLVLSAAAVIAVGGGWGTLSEIALAMKHGIPVILLGSWRLTPPGEGAKPLPSVAESPEEAVALALELARAR